MVNAENTLSKAAKARSVRHEQLKNRPCKGCGKPLNSTRKSQVKCSLKCTGFKVKVKCCVCERPFYRYKSGVVKNNCCSIKCQRRNNLFKKRYSNSMECQVSKSKKAKKRWTSNVSAIRRMESIEYLYFKKCKIKQEKKVNEWSDRCTSAKALLSQRFSSILVSDKVYGIKTWEECFLRNKRNLSNKINTHNHESWEWKCKTIAGCVKRRRKTKQLLQGRNSILKHTKQLGQQVKQPIF